MKCTWSPEALCHSSKASRYLMSDWFFTGSPFEDMKLHFLQMGNHFVTPAYYIALVYKTRRPSYRIEQNPQLMLYLESDLILSDLIPLVASNALISAWIRLSWKITKKKEFRRPTINSARLFVCEPGHLSAIFLKRIGLFATIDWGADVTHLGSSDPHQTPIPATDPGAPLPLQAPSLYTTCHPDSSTVDRIILVTSFGVLVVAASGLLTHSFASPRV